jgi:hypothetical protein
MILGYSGPATSRAIHLFDRPNYDLDSSFVTPVVVRSTSKYSLSIGYRAHSSLLDCARWPNSAINCVTNAPLSRAEVFTVLLIDYEAWVCDLNPRDINGLPGALSFILCGQTVFSLAVNPGQTGATGPCRRVQFLGATSLSVERQPMGTSLTCQPRRQQNRRKLLSTLGFELRRADIGERAKELDTEDLESASWSSRFPAGSALCDRVRKGDSWLGPNKSNSGYATTRCDPVNILLPTIFRLSALGRWQIPSTCSRGRFSR